MSSSSSAVTESAGRAAAQRSAFSQTCSLLSQYVKEKRAIGDLSLGMSRNIDGRGANDPFRRATTTMNLFPGSEKPEAASGGHENAPKAMFPQLNMPSYSLKPNFSSDDKSAQMTIFYDGQVMVFDDFPAEKAKEIMEMASKGSSSLNTSTSNAIPVANNNQVNNPVVTMNGMDSKGSSNPTTIAATACSNNKNEQHIQLPTAPTLADLPIARKASLHRFLEKRKDRITANAPYTTTNTKKPTDESSSGAPKSANNNGFSSSWLGLAAAERNLLKSQQ